jgi:hypothetical protein
VGAFAGQLAGMARRGEDACVRCALTGAAVAAATEAALLGLGKIPGVRRLAQGLAKRLATRAGALSRARPPASAPSFGKLTLVGPRTWKSSAGLIYKADPVKGNSAKHVLSHAAPSPNPKKKKHTVFVGGRRNVLPLVDEAWTKRGAPVEVPGVPPEKRTRDIYVVDMQRSVGTAGETKIRILVEKDTSNIITAYPWPK